MGAIESNLTGEDFLEDGRRFIDENFAGDGAICPCCQALVKPYETRMCTSLVRQLDFLFAECDFEVGKQVHAPTAIHRHTSSHSQYAVPDLAYFGLATNHGEGMWSVTEAGASFLRGSGMSLQAVKIFRSEVVEEVRPSQFVSYFLSGGKRDLLTWSHAHGGES